MAINGGYIYPIFKQSHIPIFEKPLEFSITPSSLAKASTGLKACQAQDLSTEPWRLVSFFSCQSSKPRRIARVHVGILWGITSGIPESSPVNPQWKWATRVPKRSHCNHFFPAKGENGTSTRPLRFDETFKDSRFFLIVHPCSVA